MIDFFHLSANMGWYQRPQQVVETQPSCHNGFPVPSGGQSVPLITEVVNNLRRIEREMYCFFVDYHSRQHIIHAVRALRAARIRRVLAVTHRILAEAKIFGALRKFASQPEVGKNFGTPVIIEKSTIHTLATGEV